MARIRTIKPEMWGDEKLSILPVIDRFVFVALISLADDAGRLLDNVKWLDGVLFLNTTDTSGPSLESLANARRIVRGVTPSGQRVIQITNWSKHQKVDHPNTKSCLPEILTTQQVTVIREDVASDSRPTRATTYDLRPVPTTDEGDLATASRGITPEVWEAAQPYLSDPKLRPVFREARIGELRKRLQGMTDFPVASHVLAKALTDMAARGKDFSPATLDNHIALAQPLLDAAAGRQAAQESLKASKAVLGQPRANGGHPESFSEDEAEG